MKVALAILFLAGMSAASVRNEIAEGNPASPVRVYIYDDLQCSDCLRLRTMLDEKILPRYGSRVAFVHRDFPLAKHNWARAAAIAGRWVYQQSSSLGITYRREIMAEQNNITSSNLNQWLSEFAVRNKLDPKGIVAALSDPGILAMVEQDYQGGVGRGIARTPTIVVGNQSLVEDILYDDLARLLDTELGH